MEKIKVAKAVLITFFAGLSAWLGNLAVPVFILMALMILDYFSAWRAAKNRNQKLDSTVGIRGIEKKVFMLVLVFVGWLGDVFLSYIGITLPLNQPVAIAITFWICANEFLSILENIKDIVGDRMPTFLQPLFEGIKSKIENSIQEGTKDE